MQVQSSVSASTPSLRKATGADPMGTGAGAISIHTFLAEGDASLLSSGCRSSSSIHTFLAEGDLLESIHG